MEQAAYFGHRGVDRFTPQQANSEHLQLPRLGVRQDDAVALAQEVFTQCVRQNGQISVKGFQQGLC